MFNHEKAEIQSEIEEYIATVIGPRVMEGNIPGSKRRILSAFRNVDRNFYLPEEVYPSTNNLFTSSANLAEMMGIVGFTGTGRTLLIGPDTGFNAAVVAQCCQYVHLVQKDPQLSAIAFANLQQQGYAISKNSPPYGKAHHDRVHVHTMENPLTFSDNGRFQRIIITQALNDDELIPWLNLDERGGRMILPQRGNPNNIRHLVSYIRDYNLLYTHHHENTL